MESKEHDSAWSPYVAGALAGVLMVLSVFMAGKYFGASTTFSRSAGMLEQLVSREHVQKLEYFQSKVPKIEWQWMFVVGILIGSFISARSSGSFKVQFVPDMWRNRFGRTPARRAVTAFTGGVVAMIGARLAGG
jgi:hypothetical protein